MKCLVALIAVSLNKFLHFIVYKIPYQLSPICQIYDKPYDINMILHYTYIILISLSFFKSKECLFALIAVALN